MKGEKCKWYNEIYLINAVIYILCYENCFLLSYHYFMYIKKNYQLKNIHIE